MTPSNLTKQVGQLRFDHDDPRQHWRGEDATVELAAAAVSGEEVVLNKAGTPQVRLVPVGSLSDVQRADRAASRKAAFGMWKGLMTEEQATIPGSMTDEEIEERWTRKFGPAA